MASILVVEDDGAVQTLLETCLSAAGHSVQLTRSAEEAWPLLRSTPPDLLILDWMLPGVYGNSLLRRLRADPSLKELPTIMLTAKSSEASRVEGLDAGADDYISKPFSPRELVARVKACLRRRPLSQLQRLVYGDVVVDRSSHTVMVAEQGRNLPPNEFRLLQHLMLSPERVFSRQQLQDAVWGVASLVDVRTVDVLVKRLRESIQGSRLVRIDTVRGVGYVLRRQPFERYLRGDTSNDVDSL